MNPEPVNQLVMCCQELAEGELAALLAPFGLQVGPVAANDAIPGSHWGDSEAGLIRHTLYVRGDTPVHSALHEASHWLLMDSARRQTLHTDAGGSQREENAVCYLQILLADRLGGMNRQRMCQDMDRWGYSFRLGSAQAWFSEDADDAIAWLQDRGWLDRKGELQLQEVINNWKR